jgi:hypothetical protein
MSDQVDRICRAANQLLGDLERAANEQQKMQCVLDAFEEVGVIAIEAAEAEHAGMPYENYIALPAHDQKEGPTSPPHP